MKYFKNILDGYIVSVSTMQGQIEITEEEYNRILSVIKNMPVAGNGFMCRLKEDLTWELAKMPEEELNDEQC